MVIINEVPHWPKINLEGLNSCSFFHAGSYCKRRVMESNKRGRDVLNQTNKGVGINWVKQEKRRACGAERPFQFTGSLFVFNFFSVGLSGFLAT